MTRLIPSAAAVARRFGPLALAALALTLPVGAAAQQPQQGEEVRDRHGDWTIRCATGTDTCIMQQVGQGNDGNDVLEVRIRKLDGLTTDNGETVPAAIQILAPLGVFLPAGVRVQVDGNEVRSAPFEQCQQGGCVVRQPMSQDFLDEMRAGSSAKVTLVAVPRQEVTVTVSLTGFTKAYNDINP